MKNKIITSLILLFLVMPFVSAFGATTFYWEESPLEIAPGETKQTELILQNMVGEEDIYLSAEFSNGGEIASFLDEDLTYFVPLGSKDVMVNLEIVVPKNTELGGREEIVIQFKQSVKKDGKMVQMTGAVSASIPILVKEVEKSPQEGVADKSSFPFGALIIAGLMVIVGIVLFRYKNIKKPRK